MNEDSPGAEPRMLFLADPGSVHDVKWMMLEAPGRKCLIVRRHHVVERGQEWLSAWLADHSVTYLGTLDDFSVVRPWKTLKGLWRLRSWVAQNRIEIFHIFFAEPNVLWALFSPLLGTRVVVTTRGTDVLSTIPRFFERDGVLSRIVAWLYRQAFRACDLIVSTSRAQVEGVERIRSTGAGRAVEVIRTGVDVEGLRNHLSGPLDSRLQGKPFILFPRLMAPIYQHEFALQAVSALPKRLRRQYRFVFVGRDGPRKEYVETIARQMEAVEAETLFLETLSASVLHKALQQASLVVMTPRSDGSPVTAAEAMLCRTPLVLPPLDYDREIFGKAFFFSEWTPESLAQMMEEVLGSEHSARLEQAAAGVENLFNRRLEMQRMRALYADLLADQAS